MQSEAEIRRIKSGEWLTYKSMRLEALRESPDAFSATLQSSRIHDDQHWQARIANASASNDLPLIAWLDGQPAGLAWGRIDETAPDDAYLFQMWVAPQYRGLGVGRKLLDVIATWARKRNADRLLLSVTKADSPAWNLYNSFGFVVAGHPEPIREGSELTAQPMELKLIHQS